MKKLLAGLALIIIGVLSFVLIAKAASVGPTLPTSGTNTGSGTAWTNPGNITADDGSSAITSAANSQDLLGSSYGFALPSNAVINGIEVSAKGLNPDGAPGTLTWRVYKGGARTTTTFTGTFSGLSPNIVTKGSSTELWGTTWTAADINATNFGAALTVSGNVSGNQTNVDYIKITVYYTIPSPHVQITQTSGTTVIKSGTVLIP